MSRITIAAKIGTSWNDPTFIGTTEPDQADRTSSSAEERRLIACSNKQWRGLIIEHKGAKKSSPRGRPYVSYDIRWTAKGQPAGGRTHLTASFEIVVNENFINMKLRLFSRVLWPPLQLKGAVYIWASTQTSKWIVDNIFVYGHDHIRFWAEHLFGICVLGVRMMPKYKNICRR